MAAEISIDLVKTFPGRPPIRARIAYPVDMYKRFVDPLEISLGAIVPEVISTWRTSDSLIRRESRGHLVTAELIRMIFYCRNTIQSYFC